jgi:hypothetical protein
MLWLRKRGSGSGQPHNQQLWARSVDHSPAVDVMHDRIEARRPSSTMHILHESVRYSGLRSGRIRTQHHRDVSESTNIWVAAAQ